LNEKFDFIAANQKSMSIELEEKQLP